jgi:hypothetical protein
MQAPAGSKSINIVLLPDNAKAADKFMAEVDFPTFPFGVAIAIIFPMLVKCYQIKNQRILCLNIRNDKS